MASSPRIVLLFASACLQTVAAWLVMADRRRLAAAPKPMEHAIEDQLDKKCPIQVQRSIARRRLDLVIAIELIEKNPSVLL
jgi:hypothetical protein